MRSYVSTIRFIGFIVLFGLAGPISSQDWPMWGGTARRNMAAGVRNIPATWDLKTKTNIKWKADLGSTSYGNPVAADGKVFVGTNNGRPRNPDVTGDKGILMCFRESDGKFLWQAVSDKLETGPENDWPDQGVCSSPAVDGKRLYFVSNRCELVCLDTEGFAVRSGRQQLRGSRALAHFAALPGLEDRRDQVGGAEARF
jgi:outer membrane protein assembly factor BamB